MIYFDNAATTFPKPMGVAKEVGAAISHYANPGRGAHKLAMAAAEEVYSCRTVAARLFGASPERVVITSGATHGLNVAIASARNQNNAVLISNLEHNSVLRPAKATGREVRIFDSCLYLDGEEQTYAILNSIDQYSHNVKTLICTAASNICGATMPIAEIGKYCRDRGILFIVDGAQAGGILDIDMKRDYIDVLCLAGHKGLYGPMGCGLMLVGENVSLSPLMYGGSGVDSEIIEMPQLPPERYEAGTLPMPLISGLKAGMKFVAKVTPQKIREHERRLARKLKRGLENMRHVRVYAGNHDGGTVLFNVSGMSSEEVALLLDKRNICTRAGLHCAPLAHRTLNSDGAVRISFGYFNRDFEVDYLLNILDSIQNHRLTHFR